MNKFIIKESNGVKCIALVSRQEVDQWLMHSWYLQWLGFGEYITASHLSLQSCGFHSLIDFLMETFTSISNRRSTTNLLSILKRKTWNKLKLHNTMNPAFIGPSWPYDQYLSISRDEPPVDVNKCGPLYYPTKLLRVVLFKLQSWS